MSESSEQLLIDYALGTLSRSERQVIDLRLENEPILRQELHRYQETLALLAYGSPRPAPTSLKARILAGAQANPPAANQRVGTQNPGRWGRLSWLHRSEQQYPRHNSPRPQPTNLRRAKAQHWQRGALAASLLLSLGLGLDNYHLRQRPVGADQPQAPFPAGDAGSHTEHVHFLKLRTPQVTARSTPQSSPQGKVVLDETTGRVLLIAQALPPLTPNEAYYLWAVMEKSAVLCGRVPVGSDALTIAELSVDPALYSSEITSMQVVRGDRHHPPRSPGENVILVTAI